MKTKNIQNIYQLSPLQQGILFHCLHTPESHAYFVQLCCVLRGNLNITAFEKSWQQVVDRHTALRTAFYWQDLEKPHQIVYRKVQVSLEQHDWRAVDSSQQQQKLDDFLARERKKGFDLSQAPLMRLMLIRIADDSYYFVWSKHHLILDGWSTALVLKQVMEVYRTFCQGQNVPLITTAYGDYIGWLRQQDLSKAEVFWRQTLKEIKAPTSLAYLQVDRLFDREKKHRQQTVKLSVSTTKKLQTFARQYGLTLNTLVQGAWAILLSRYAGEEDVIYGVTVSGRPAELPKVESTVGMFINTLPMGVKLAGEDLLLPWLQKLQAQLIEIRQYEYSPLVEIQGWSEIPRDLPLFESILVFENYPIDEALIDRQSNLEIQNVTNFEATNYLLTITVIPGNELSITISHDSGFATDTIEQILRHFQSLLSAIVVSPQQKLSELSFLTETEQQQLLGSWNNTAREYPQDKCIHQLFEAQVKKTPDAVAVVFAAETLSYRELNAKSNQLADYLQTLGVETEVKVGICVERSPEMVIGLLAILKTGGTYIPLDPNYPQERLAYMLEDSRPKVLLTQQPLVESLPTHQAQIVCLDRVWEQISDRTTENLESKLAIDNLAYIIYTSGSTGKPKGVMNTHRGILNRLLWMQDVYQLNPTDRVLQKTPFSFDVSVWEFFWTLMAGARLVVARPEGHKDPNYLVNLILQQQITTLHFVPSMLQVFLEAEGVEKCQSIKRVIASGEALPPKLQQRFFQRLDTQLYNLYGPTEAAVDVTFWQCKKEDLNQKTVPIGSPIANIQTYILADRLQPVPVGVIGELYLGGVGICRGYLDRPDLTAERFIPNPFSSQAGERLYRRDLARYLPSGEIEYLGRIDNQVKIRGLRIELGEIEVAIATHPAVRESVVIVTETSPDLKNLVAYVVASPESGLTISQLREFLISKLPDYMIPSALVRLEQMPLTPNGKVDRRSLPAPEFMQLSSSAILLPATPTENLLAGIWREVLGREKVGVENNFFELGGHSLIATRVISQIRQVFAVELPLRSLFEHPTIVGLAKEIDLAIKGDSRINTTAIEKVPRSQELPLSYAQQRLWFLTQLEPDSAFYNIPAAVRLQGKLNQEALTQSFNYIITRHETLRTNFQVTQEEETRAVIAPTDLFTLTLLDLSSLPVEEKSTQVQKQIETEAQQPFALGSDRLIRIKLLRLEAEEHIVLLTMHHIISDGWSVGVLVEELATLYRAFAEEKPSPLPNCRYSM